MSISPEDKWIAYKNADFSLDESFLKDSLKLLEEIEEKSKNLGINWDERIALEEKYKKYGKYLKDSNEEAPVSPKEKELMDNLGEILNIMEKEDEKR